MMEISYHILGCKKDIIFVWEDQNLSKIHRIPTCASEVALQGRAVFVSLVPEETFEHQPILFVFVSFYRLKVCNTVCE